MFVRTRLHDPYDPVGMEKKHFISVPLLSRVMVDARISAFPLLVSLHVIRSLKLEPCTVIGIYDPEKANLGSSMEEILIPPVGDVLVVVTVLTSTVNPFA